MLGVDAKTLDNELLAPIVVANLDFQDCQRLYDT
jgi:hypothetical protein